MQGFSFGEALSAGLRIIARHPLAVPVWTGLYLLLVGLPTIAILAHTLPAAIANYQQIAQHAGRPDPARMMALRSQTFGWQPVLWLLQVIAHTLIMAAVFRSVLEPREGRWAFLRLGMRELWLGLTYVVLLVATFIMVFLLVLPLVIASAIMAGVAHDSGGSAAGGAVLVALFGFVGLGVIVWVLLRLCLALPMTFAERRFMLYESWDLTRGHAFKMFLVYLVLAIGVVLFELAVVAVAGVTLIPQLRAMAAGAASAATVGDTLRAALDVIHRQAPMLATLVIVVSLLAMAIQTILLAPLVEIYRELTGAPETAAA
jgi:hypothetical protein